MFFVKKQHADFPLPASLWDPFCLNKFVTGLWISWAHLNLCSWSHKLWTNKSPGDNGDSTALMLAPIPAPLEPLPQHRFFPPMATLEVSQRITKAGRRPRSSSPVVHPPPIFSNKPRRSVQQLNVPWTPSGMVTPPCSWAAHSFWEGIFPDVQPEARTRHSAAMHSVFLGLCAAPCSWLSSVSQEQPLPVLLLVSEGGSE